MEVFQGRRCEQSALILVHHNDVLHCEAQGKNHDHDAHAGSCARSEAWVALLDAQVDRSAKLI